MNKIMEFPCNWRRLRNLMAGKPPEANDGQPPLSSDPQTVFLPVGFDLYEVRDWLKANTVQAHRIYARLEIEAHRYRVDRSVLGANFQFESGDDAFFFKMRF